MFYLIIKYSALCLKRIIQTVVYLFVIHDDYRKLIVFPLISKYGHKTL